MLGSIKTFLLCFNNHSQNDLQPIPKLQSELLCAKYMRECIDPLLACAASFSVALQSAAQQSELYQLVTLCPI